ncbi:MAG: aminoacetone oxidase family FAD-binding enzyme [Clostridia bacterium]|nr:aminoacetone oxidase family FAD-binding enzyme [Clostridia bacterium]
MANKTDCIILGGGAAGLAACAALSARGVHVTLAERLDRVGKKIMASGNGRCNLSNADMNAAYYAEAAPFVSSVYQQTPPQEVLSFFSSLGLMTSQEDGRIYPRTMMASSVLDVLRAGCARQNATILTGAQAVSLSPSRRGGWSVQLASGEGLFAPIVLCAMGGSASPHLGTDGSSAALLGALGHTVTPLYPALVQLRCEHGALKSLKGIRVQAALSLMIDGQTAAQETGELLFADYGVSGVCVFQLSRYAAKALGKKKKVALQINLLPEIAPGQTLAWLQRRAGCMPECEALSLFTGVFPRLLTQAIVKEAGVSADTPVRSLSAQSLSALASAISALSLPVIGTQGFKNAQVTAGGISLDEVDPCTMASRLFDGLYIAGEALDADGPCGGYNLHFAFAGALTAAKAIASRLGV